MRALVSVVSLCVLSIAGFAQGLGGFVGTVTDPSGAAVASAKVTVTEAGTGFARSTITSAEGFYTFPSLRPAEYNLSVEAPGFRTSTQSGIVLGADQTATVNVKLDLGATSETVSIVAESVPGRHVHFNHEAGCRRKTIVELPLNGRNAATLTLLVPRRCQLHHRPAPTRVRPRRFLAQSRYRPTVRGTVKSVTGSMAVTTSMSTRTSTRHFRSPMPYRSSACRPAITTPSTDKMPAAL